MRLCRAVSIIFLLAAAVSCRKVPTEVEVSTTRELTAWDHGADSLIPVMPPEWRRVTSTELRLFNYRFGETGEVYISRARGGVMPNVNRWLGQFGQAPIVSTDSLETITVLGKLGVLVQAKGKFGGGMGKLPIEDAGLLGIIVDLGGEGLLAVKMIGKADAVMAEKQRLIKFCESIRINEAALKGN